MVRLFVFSLVVALLFLSANCQYEVVFDNYLYSQPAGSVVILRAPEVTSSSALTAYDDSKQVKWSPGFIVPQGEEWIVSLLEIGVSSTGISTFYFSFQNSTTSTLPPAFNSSLYVGSVPPGNSRSVGRVTVFNGTINPALVLTNGTYWLHYYSQPSSSPNYFTAFTLSGSQILQAAWCGGNISCSLYFNGSDKVLAGRVTPGFPVINTWNRFTVNPSVFALNGFKVGVCCLPDFNCTQKTRPECESPSVNGTYKFAINSTYVCNALVCQPSPSPSPTNSPSVSPSLSRTSSPTVSTTNTPTASLSTGASPSGTPSASLSVGASPSNSPSPINTDSSSFQGTTTGTGSILHSWVNILI